MVGTVVTRVNMRTVTGDVIRIETVTGATMIHNITLDNKSIIMNMAPEGMMSTMEVVVEVRRRDASVSFRRISSSLYN